MSEPTKEALICADIIADRYSIGPVERLLLAERITKDCRLHELTAERDSLRADKDRLDWLNGLVADIDMIPSDQVLNQGEGRLLWKMQFEYPEITRDGEETLRDAIDAARAERKEQE